MTLVLNGSGEKAASEKGHYPMATVRCFLCRVVHLDMWTFNPAGKRELMEPGEPGNRFSSQFEHRKDGGVYEKRKIIAVQYAIVNVEVAAYKRINRRKGIPDNTEKVNERL